MQNNNVPSGELTAGCKAMIVGARTDIGQRHIGKIVTCIDPVNPGETREVGGRERLNSSGTTIWLVEGDVDSHLAKMPKGQAFFLAKHLMPLPPLENPSVEDKTFTPIVQKEGA